MPTTQGLDFFLYVMFEFQSGISRWMVVRTQVYEGLFWQSLIDEKELRAGDRLPPLLLLALYNGDDAWTAPTRTEELLAVSRDQGNRVKDIIPDTVNLALLV